MTPELANLVTTAIPMRSVVVAKSATIAVFVSLAGASSARLNSPQPAVFELSLNVKLERPLASSMVVTLVVALGIAPVQMTTPVTQTLAQNVKPTALSESASSPSAVSTALARTDRRATTPTLPTAAARALSTGAAKTDCRHISNSSGTGPISRSGPFSLFGCFPLPSSRLSPEPPLI